MTPPPTSRDAAVAAAQALHDRGNAATVHNHNGRWAALNLEQPTTEIAADLTRLGLAPDRAHTEADRLKKRGY